MHFKDQSVGNCTWASIKATFFAQIYLLALAENEPAIAEKEAYSLYKSFTAYGRVEVLNDYLSTTDLASVDLNLLRSCKEKALLKVGKEGTLGFQKGSFYEALKAINDFEEQLGISLPVREPISLLWNKDLDPHLRDYIFRTIADLNLLDQVRSVADKSSLLTLPQEKTGKIVLHEALNDQNIEAIKFILSAHNVAEILSIEDKQGFKALDHAIFTGNLDIIKLINNAQKRPS